MKKIIAALFLLLPFCSPAQNKYDSIQQVIEQYNGPLNSLTPKLRQILVNLADSNRITEAKPFYEYATIVLEPQKIYAIGYGEKLLLAYILEDYTFILNHIHQLNIGSMPNYFSYEEPTRNHHLYIPDRLSPVLRKYTITNFATIRNQLLNTTKLQKEESHILAIYLRYALADNKDDRFSAHALYNEANTFFGKNYEGRYAFLLKRVMLEEVTPTPLHFTFEAGLGPVFRGKQYKEYMPAAVGVQLRAGIAYKKTLLELAFMENGASLRNPLQVKNETWQTDSSMRVFTPSVTVGYFLYDTKRWAIYPFAGVNKTYMKPEYNGPTQLKRTVIQTRPGITAGVAVQYKFKKWAYSYSTRKGGDFYEYFGLRLTYMNRNFKSPAISGNAWACTFSFLGDFGERILPAPWSWFNGTRRGERHYYRNNQRRVNS